jgi:3-hydroxy-9,10-secoandrosta-1,3,5(10)-triene-9,17-dione monooxygenase
LTETERAATVTREEYLERARALVPAVRERAAAAEEMRRMPDETIEDFKAAGLFRGIQPARWGGYELDPRTFYEAVVEIGRADASAAWVLAVVGVHNWHVGLFPLQAQEEVWGKDTNVLVASSYAPIGKVEYVEGGFRLSGRWSFSSGTDHCDWLLTNSIAVDPADPSKRHGYTFLVPRKDYTIVDDWNVAGLSGSGSKTFVINNAFVPEYRTIGITATRELRTPGIEVNPSPLFKCPQMSVFLWAVSSPMIGVAQGMLDLYLEQAERRIAGNPKAPLLQDAFAHEAIAKASMDIKSSQLRLAADLDEMLWMAKEGSSFPIADRSRWRWGAAYCVETSLRAVDLLFETAGGFSIHRDNPMQRMFRDAHAMRAHASNNVKKAAEGYGRALLGLPDEGGIL